MSCLFKNYSLAKGQSHIGSSDNTGVSKHTHTHIHTHIKHSEKDNTGKD